MKKVIGEVLLRRNELKRHTDLRGRVESQQRIFDPIVRRSVVSEQAGVEEVVAVLPKCSRDMLVKEKNFYSHQWRLADSAVQQANHTVHVKIAATVMQDFDANEQPKEGEIEPTLAELLTRRKYLEEKVEEAHNGLDLTSWVEKVTARVKITDNIDELLRKVVPVPAYQLLGKQCWYLTQLRLVETAVQKTNNTVEIEVPDSVFVDFRVETQ